MKMVRTGVLTALVPLSSLPALDARLGYWADMERCKANGNKVV